MVHYSIKEKVKVEAKPVLKPTIEEVKKEKKDK